MSTLKLALHAALCAAIFWSCFCRQAKSSASTTREDIRTVFWLLAVSSLSLGIAPWAPRLWPELEAYTVTWPSLALLGAVAAVQAVTAKHWRRGVPPAFSKEG
jgi:drug/metabolite transporter (DMT)-like permease